MEASRRQGEVIDVVNAQKYLGFPVLHSFINQNRIYESLHKKSDRRDLDDHQSTGSGLHLRAHTFFIAVGPPTGIGRSDLWICDIPDSRDTLLVAVLRRRHTVPDDFHRDGNILKKMVFPKICLPLITTGTALVNNALLLLAIIAVFAVLG